MLLDDQQPDAAPVFLFYYLNDKKALFLLTLSYLVIAGNQYIELIQKGVQRK